MDIVIPYDGRDERGIGLEAAVLSWRRFYSECDAIYVVGAVPKAHGTIHIPFDDDPLFTYANVVRKTLEACRDDAISDPFIISHDDVVLVGDIARVQHVANGRLSDDARNDTYGASLRRTGEALRAAGASEWNFELHRPTVIHKGRYADAAAMFPDWQTDKIQLTSAYLNRIGFTPERGTDAKLRELSKHTPETLEAHFRRVKVVSFMDAVPTWARTTTMSWILGGDV